MLGIVSEVLGGISTLQLIMLISNTFYLSHAFQSDNHRGVF
jgi:hypothetical protein